MAAISDWNYSKTGIYEYHEYSGTTAFESRWKTIDIESKIFFSYIMYFSVRSWSFSVTYYSSAKKKWLVGME